jgi:hypothetical protein
MIQLPRDKYADGVYEDITASMELHHFRQESIPRTPGAKVAGNVRKTGNGGGRGERSACHKDRCTARTQHAGCGQPDTAGTTGDENAKSVQVHNRMLFTRNLPTVQQV